MKTMIKFYLMLTAVLAVISNTAIGQTIAVAPLKTYNVMANNLTVSRYTEVELIKLNQFAVLDQYDMKEVASPELYDSCYGKECLVQYGRALKVDYILSGNIDKLNSKLVINLKLFDIASGELSKSKSMEFIYMESELQRMIGIVLSEMFGAPADIELSKRLAFNSDRIEHQSMGSINNSGPRMGVAYTVGDVNEFMTRSESRGGLEMKPITSNIGYQFEVQYVGTENFSGLFECLVTVSGLEQGKFIPGIALLNGYRFGRGGWEIALGPSFGLTTTSKGFFDDQGQFGAKGMYWSSSDFNSAGHDEDALQAFGYDYAHHLDTRGDMRLSTRWVVGFGRTFRSGSLNVPVNLFYSSQKGGGMMGLSVGFNIVRSKNKVGIN